MRLTSGVLGLLRNDAKWGAPRYHLREHSMNRFILATLIIARRSIDGSRVSKVIMPSPTSLGSQSKYRVNYNITASFMAGIPNGKWWCRKY